MISKHELIEISGIMDTSPDYFAFYEFACKYIQGMKEEGKTGGTDFIAAIRRLGNNSSIRNNHFAFGKVSISSNEIKKWCLDVICSNKELQTLTLDELHFVMGYCARRAKIAKERK